MNLYTRTVNLLVDKLSPDEVAVVIRRHIARAPTEHAEIYRVCRQYVNRYNNENNDDIQTNGELHLMEEYLGRSRVVFDVGANVGKWAVRALGINPNLRLYCFEPSKPAFQKLLANQFPKNVTCNNVGLGSASEEKALYVFEEGSGMNSLYPRSGLEDGWKLQPQKQTETIRLETLDRYCSQQSIGEIDFLKLDVEGHELEVFKGATGMLSGGKIKLIQFEYGGCNIDAKVFLKDIFEFFQPFAYSLFKLCPQRLQKLERYDVRLENFQYQNWAALRKT
jgi:FkbM family methyltransferase